MMAAPVCQLDGQQTGVGASSRDDAPRDKAAHTRIYLTRRLS